jgi:hypothetical protein
VSFSGAGATTDESGAAVALHELGRVFASCGRDGPGRDHAHGVRALLMRVVLPGSVAWRGEADRKKAGFFLVRVLSRRLSL